MILAEPFNDAAEKIVSVDQLQIRANRLLKQRMTSGEKLFFRFVVLPCHKARWWLDGWARKRHFNKLLALKEKEYIQEHPFLLKRSEFGHADDNAVRARAEESLRDQRRSNPARMYIETGGPDFCGSECATRYVNRGWAESTTRYFPGKAFRAKAERINRQVFDACTDHQEKLKHGTLKMMI